MSPPTPFAHQVGGHPSTILSSPLSHSTLIKPSSLTEHAFYTSLGPSLHPDFVGVWTPEYYGMLKLQGKMGEGGVEKVEGSGEEMLVLENLTYRFVRPNVLDIKLGTQLWDGQAREDKRVRMEKVARDTTSGTTGIRLTGFQVWDELKSEYVGTDKTYGKSLKPSELPSGFSRFFFGTHLDRPSPPTTPHQPVPLVRLLLLAILVRLRALEALLPLLEMRMRGGSLLIVVEGDTEALTSAIERAGTTNHLPGPSSRSKLAEEGRQYAREEAEGEEVDQEGKDDDSDDGSDSSSIKTTDSATDLPLPHTLLPFELRLIDFAHTTDSRIEDGAGAGGGGPDEGVILGVSNVIACLEGLVRSLGVDREEL